MTINDILLSISIAVIIIQCSRIYRKNLELEQSRRTANHHRSIERGYKHQIDYLQHELTAYKTVIDSSRPAVMLRTAKAPAEVEKAQLLEYAKKLDMDARLRTALLEKDNPLIDWIEKDGARD